MAAQFGDRERALTLYRRLEKNFTLGPFGITTEYGAHPHADCGHPQCMANGRSYGSYLTNYGQQVRTQAVRTVLGLWDGSDRLYVVVASSGAAGVYRLAGDRCCGSGGLDTVGCGAAGWMGEHSCGEAHAGGEGVQRVCAAWQARRAAVCRLVVVVAP